MTQPSPLLSVITPSFNQAAYLESTLRSVLAQDYPCLEYWVIDGGSSDGSVEIIRRYAGQLAGWISEPDQGQADAINKGLQRAQGEIVAWLNSDDLYLPGAAAEAVAAFQADPELGLVFGDAITIDSAGHPLHPLKFGDWGLAELMRFRIICQPAVFMRRAVLEQAGGLDRTYHFMLDHQLWIRMARLAPVRHLPRRWAAARHHPQAKNVALASGFGQETLRLLGWMSLQPDLAARLQQDRRRIEAGAYRLNARYLLDGDQPGPALHSYLKALVRSPRFTLQHAHRILYAALLHVGARRLAARLAQIQSVRRPALEAADFPGLQNWPGLALEGKV